MSQDPTYAWPDAGVVFPDRNRWCATVRRVATLGAEVAACAVSGDRLNMNLDLSGVASFVVLAEENHFGHAAGRLGLTSSALTKRIQRLEWQLGVVLVERGPSGTTGLTTSGHRFADFARLLLDVADEACAQARAAEPSHYRQGGET